MKNSRKVTGILLACCALLMVAIAGLGVTLAKYTTSAPAKSDSARVAKFGVMMAWEDADAELFSTTYKTDDTSKKDAIETSVNASAKVIAPGTSGSITLTFDGSEASEVAFTLAIDIKAVYSAGNWLTGVGGSEYHPIVYSATSNATYQVGAGAPQDISLGANGTFTQDFAAGTTLDGTITISWSWPFSSVNDVNDPADTYMSSVADATYSITISATATQID